MHVVVCEDEAMYRKSIQEKIERRSQINHHADIKLSLFSSSEDFLEQWRQNIKIDVIFMDIMFQNEMDGMKVAKQIRLTDSYVPIVFVTNSDAYIREGYEVCALRYLGKPMCYSDIALCLDIAYKQYTLSHNEFFILSEAGRRFAIPYADIIYFEAQSPSVLIFKKGDTVPIKLRYRFTNILPKLSQELFIPCHRSYIVNMVHVRSLKRTDILLSNGKILPLSKSYVDIVNRAFDSYYQEGCVNLYVDRI